MKRSMFVVAVMGAFGATAALATLPEDQVVKYSIRVDPADEESEVLFTVSLELTAIESSGDLIKWEVSEAIFTEVGSNGVPSGAWTKSRPTVTSSDGYWWVEHQDFDDLLEAEFSAPPTLEGTAPPDGTDDDLEYFVGAGTLTRSEQAMFDGKVAGLTHEFIREEDVDPIVDGGDEPAEIDPVVSAFN